MHCNPKNINGNKPLEDVLLKAGFTASQGGRYAKNGLQLNFDQGWVVLAEKAGSSFSTSFKEGFDPPGLWKTIPDGSKKAIRRFDIPPLDFIHTPVLLGQMVAWALDTRKGHLPDHWRCPCRETVVDAIPEGGLTIQSGTSARQGKWVSRPHRSAIEFPLTAPLPTNLSPFRRTALGRVLSEAQCRWKMIRFVYPERKTDAGIRVEVDMTGAPAAAVGMLARASIAALHGAVSWIIESIELLTGERNDLRSIESEPWIADIFESERR